MFPKLLTFLRVPDNRAYVFRSSPFALPSEIEEFIHVPLLEPLLQDVFKQEKVHIMSLV